MHKTDGNNLYYILDLAFRKDILQENIEDVFLPLLTKGMKLKKVEKGEQYLNSGTEINKISLMIKGKCHIIKFTLDGKSVVVDTMEGAQVFGVCEIMNDIDCYSSTVSCVELSYFIEIPVYLFKDNVFENKNISNLMLKYMMYLNNRCYEKNYKELTNTNEESVLIYIYNSCIGHRLPYKILIDRKNMALELNIGLRTLYRHIEKLRKLGIITINCGKIMVDEYQFKRIGEKLQGNC